MALKTPFACGKQQVTDSAIGQVANQSAGYS